MLEELLKKEVLIETFSPSYYYESSMHEARYFGKVIGVNEEYLILDCYASKSDINNILRKFKKGFSEVDKSNPKKTYIKQSFIASIEVIE